ncbi:MAG: MFS transporter [Janthinobacterium lividum]
MNSQLPSAFRAFQHRNYAFSFSGQSLSYIGTWMQRTAVSWVVYSLTHSTLMLGFTMFAQQFPSFVLSRAGGIVSERYDRRTIFLLTQTASLLQAAALVLRQHFEILLNQTVSYPNFFNQ